jgi:hypothetical protein
MTDQMSLANSKGRMGFWVRGDANVDGPAYLPSGNNYLINFTINAADRYDQFQGWVQFNISAATRKPVIGWGNQAVGTGFVTVSDAYILPTDGNWHFYGFYWDYAAGQYGVRLDSTVSSISNYFNTTDPRNDTSLLAPTEAQNRASAGDTDIRLLAHLPVAEFMINSGESFSSTLFNSWYAPTPNATMRATNMPLAAVAEPGTVNVWDTLSSLAQTSLSAYRCDETDSYNFLPQGYFGETAQMTSSAVQDTSKNTADLVADVDTSKTRNSISVQFKDSRIDGTIQALLLYTSVVEVPAGTSYITFPLDIPCAEAHGAFSTISGFVNLTSAQITTPILPKNSNFITANNSPDGGGTILDNLQVSAQLISADATSIYVKLVNNTKNPAYLANNGDQIPVLQFLGYGVRSTDGYIKLSDAESVKIRGERSLSVDLPWIQDRLTAQDIAAGLLGTLANPRPQLALNVMGDPRRKPGQLITVADAEGTHAAGSWRVLSVTHNVNGPQYTQDLVVSQVLPAAVWDGMDGWDEGVWS